MLILTRKKGESFLTDNGLEVFILDVQPDRVKIGINAPKDVKIVRRELYETRQFNREAIESVLDGMPKDIAKLIKKEPEDS